MCKQRSRTGRGRYGPISKQTLSFLLAVGPVVLGANPAQGQFGFDQLLGRAPLGNQTSFWTAWSVATDSKHNVHVIYMGLSPTNPGDPDDAAPYYRKYDDLTGAWLPQMRLTPAAPSYVMGPSKNYIAIATDCMNNVHTLWAEYVPGTGPTYLRYRMWADSTGTWGPVESVRTIVSVYNASIEGISLAADQRGNAYVVWCEASVAPDFSMVVWNVFSRIRDAGTGGWKPRRQLTFHPLVTNSIGAIHPTIAVQNFWATDFEEAVAHIAWYEWLGVGTGNVGYTALGYDKDGVERPHGGPLLLPAGESSYPSIAARCRTVHLVWKPLVPGPLVHRIGLTPLSGPDLAVFEPAVATGVVLDGPGPIAVDGLENVHLVGLSGSNVVEFVWKKATRTWGAATVVTDVPGSWGWPSVASDERGDLHVVWTSGTDGVFYDRGNCLVLPIAPPAGPASIAVVTPELAAARRIASPGELLPVLIHLAERPDKDALRRSVDGLSASERRRRVCATLQEFAERSQASLLADLAAAARLGEAAEVRSIWLINAVAAKVSPGLLDRLAARTDVAVIDHDPMIPMLDAVVASRGASADEASADREASPDAVRGLPPIQPTPPANSAGSFSQTARVEPESSPRTPDVAWNVSWIGAPAWWDEGYRGDCILVAVLDTGIDLRHSDLMGRLWGGAQGHGWDFVNNDNDPMDDNGHGTHVAGTIAGDGTGGTITGVAPQARLMAVKVLDRFGGGSWGTIVAGIGYALANNAQVLNLSLGGRCQSFAVRAALREAADGVALAGVTMCVAAGNSRCNDRPPNVVATPGDVPPPWISPSQPFIDPPSGVTTVGATSYMSNTIAPFSNPGPVDWSQVLPLPPPPPPPPPPLTYNDWWLCDPRGPNVGLIKPDVSAPGMGINSTTLGGGYSGDTWDGTSMATPHVAGLAALILSRNSNLTSSAIHGILETSALDLGPVGKDNDYGAGRISASNAFLLTPQGDNPLVLLSRRIDDTPPGGNGDGGLDAGETADLLVTLYNQGAYAIGDVLGILGTTDAYVQVTDSLATFGDIPPDSTRENVADPFRVVVDPVAPEGHVVQFTLLVSGDGACTVFVFADTLGGGGGGQTGACCFNDGSCQVVSQSQCQSLGGSYQGDLTVCNPNPCPPCTHLADHVAGNVRFTVTDQGILGFLSDSLGVGSGFVYPQDGGLNRLYIGGFMAGTDPSYVLNRDHSRNPVQDWEPSGCLESGPIGEWSESWAGTYADAGHPVPRGLEIRQSSYAWADATHDDYVILLYEAVNTGASTISDLWLGSYVDWDLDADGGFDQNLGAVDAQRGLIYMWRDGGGDGARVGVEALYPRMAQQMSFVHNPTYVYPLHYLTDADRFHFLSGDDPAYVVEATPAPDDWSAVLGLGPVDLAPGRSVTVAFAVVAGGNRDALLANAGAAQLKFDEIWGAALAVEPPSAPRAIPLRLALGPGSPNPFGANTVLGFELPSGGSASVAVYDATGRHVATLVDRVLAPGRHLAAWDGRDGSGRPAGSGVYYVRLRAAGGTRTQKLLRVR